MTIEWQAEGPVAVVAMDDGENRHNPDFIAALLGVLADISAKDSLCSVLLTSRDAKSWSQGLDIAWLATQYAQQDLSSIKDFVYAINELLVRILAYPLPVIASINGHVVGNGLILACACDFRFMRADRGYAILPAVELGFQFLPGMIAVLRKAMPNCLLEEMQYTGARLGAQRLAEHHVVRKACEGPEALQRDSLEFARSFAKSRGGLGEMKRRMNADIIRKMNEEDPPFIDALDLVTRG